jgi:GNAT superfamily N-acetyltransferase
MSDIEVLPVDSSRWSDLETLFGRAGASNGCWGQYWLLGTGYHQRDRAENRRDLEQQIHAGRAGLLAYERSNPVAWARFTPRTDLTWLTTRFSKFDFATDNAWSLACFYVKPQARGQGAMRSLIRYAAQWGHAEGVPIEGYPIDPGVPRATRNRFSGVLPAFLAEGFIKTGQLANDRVLVRSE